MHKPEYVLGNETHKILLDFEIETDDVIQARRQDQMIRGAYDKFPDFFRMGI